MLLVGSLFSAQFASGEHVGHFPLQNPQNVCIILKNNMKSVLNFITVCQQRQFFPPKIYVMLYFADFSAIVSKHSAPKVSNYSSNAAAEIFISNSMKN